MRRATFVLAAVLAAAAIAGALVYRPSPQSPSGPGQAVRSELQQPRAPLSAETQPLASASRANGTVDVPAEQRSQSDEPGSARKRAPLDEATVREHIRQSATEQIRDEYTLLLGDLALEAQEKTDLVALLIEMRIEGTWSGQIRGRTIPDQERYERIAAVIGDKKLLELIELEENRSAYWETTQIARLMRRKNVPLTEKQLDGVFDIVVEVHDRYPYRPPAAELDRNSDEYIEFVLTQTDEIDRHVVELAPSVLSPTQVVHLFNAYDFMSRDRRSDVERQKKRKAAGDPVYIKMGWITPGRWPAEVMRD